MRLPVIKHINNYIEENGSERVEENIKFLEFISEIRGIKEEELNAIGELLSNMYGALQVSKSINEGIPKKEALNNFMSRVMGSIDKQ